MRNPSRSEPQSPATMLLRRLAVVFLVGLTGGVALSFIGLANRTIAPAAFELASSSCLGLLSGFASRRALRSHTPALRGLASLAAVIVGMLFVGWVSGGEAGLVIHHLSPAATDWSGLIHLAMAAASATLALYAWSSAQVRRITDAAPPTTVAPARSDGRSISRPRRAPPRASAPGVGRSRLAGIASRAEEPMHALLRRFSAWRASLQTIRLPGRLPT